MQRVTDRSGKEETIAMEMCAIAMELQKVGWLHPTTPIQKTYRFFDAERRRAVWLGASAWSVGSCHANASLSRSASL